MKLALTISADVFKYSPEVAISLGEYLGVGILTGYEVRYEQPRGRYYAFIVAENAVKFDFELLARASNGYGRLEMLDEDVPVDADGNPAPIPTPMSDDEDDEDEGFRW